MDIKQEHQRLQEQARYAGYVVSVTKNEQTDQAFDEAIRELMEFEREHGLGEER